MSREELFNGEPVIAFTYETDRRNFLRLAGLVGVGAALVAGGTVAAAPTAMAAPKFGKGDIGILNYALTLEYVESTFYAKGIDAGILKGRDHELVKPIRSHEQAHVKAVKAAVQKLGGTPVDKPKLKFPQGTFDSADKFLATAVQFEELGVVAYQGQVTHIKHASVLSAAAAIAGVESRHAAILEDLTNGKVFKNGPIEAHKPMSYVLGKVKPFLA